MSHQPAPTPSTAIPRGIATAIVILGFAGGAWLILDKLADAPGQAAAGIAGAANQAARDFAQSIKDTLGLEPKIIHSSTVIHEGARGTLEIAFAEREQVTDARYVNTWAGSTKTLHLRGRFLVKAGYKLDGENWHVKLRDDGVFDVNMPPPSVLSCELLKEEILVEEDGFWNRLDKVELEQVKNKLLEEARKQAAAGDLATRAQQEFERRLLDAARGRGISPAPVFSQPVL